jgi:AcrR family transcriptional regulator
VCFGLGEHVATPTSGSTYGISARSVTASQLALSPGLGRSSIYNTFKSKHDLFERALARYIHTMTTTQLAVLDTPGRTAGERSARSSTRSSRARRTTGSAVAAWDAWA